MTDKERAGHKPTNKLLTGCEASQVISNCINTVDTVDLTILQEIIAGILEAREQWETL